jgi:hypothetical protein
MAQKTVQKLLKKEKTQKRALSLRLLLLVFPVFLFPVFLFPFLVFVSHFVAPPLMVWGIQIGLGIALSVLVRQLSRIKRVVHVERRRS